MRRSQLDAGRSDCGGVTVLCLKAVLPASRFKVMKERGQSKQ